MFSSQTTIQNKQLRTFISLVIISLALVLTFAPLPGLTRKLTIVSGTELQEPLQELAQQFESENPQVKLELEFMGSQDMVNRYLEDDSFDPAIIIPAEEAVLQELNSESNPFVGTPQPIAKTLLVAIAWAKRGEQLFPNSRFSWQALKKALELGDWHQIANRKDWGSFEVAMTNPLRSNSAVLALDLWRKSLGYELSSSEIKDLVALVKRSIYQPARSTDILLQEFIARGVNEADVAIVYESIALHRWQQAQTSKGYAYQIYYPNPTVETRATAAILNRNLDAATRRISRQFIDFLTQSQQQETFAKYGFRPVNENIDLKKIADSPWANNISIKEINSQIKIFNPPDKSVRKGIQDIWQKSS